MDQHPEQPGADAVVDGDAGGPVRTGVPRVDEVLAAVEGLEERPIEEHVGVFETAHTELRRALDADPGTDVPPSPADPA